MHPALKAFIGGTAATVATVVAHGPLGAGERALGGIETRAAAVVRAQEVPGIAVRVAPGTRDAVLSGPANDFQQQGFADCVAPLEGVRSVRWETGARLLPSGLPCGGGIG